MLLQTSRFALDVSVISTTLSWQGFAWQAVREMCLAPWESNCSLTLASFLANAAYVSMLGMRVPTALVDPWQLATQTLSSGIVQAV